MCDEQDLARWARGKVSRRAFGGGAMAAGVAACAPVNADVKPASRAAFPLTRRAMRSAMAKTMTATVDSMKAI